VPNVEYTPHENTSLKAKPQVGIIEKLKGVAMPECEMCAGIKSLSL